MKTILSILCTFLLFSCAPTIDFKVAQEQVRLYEEFKKMDSENSTDEASSEATTIYYNSTGNCKPCENNDQSNCNFYSYLGQKFVKDNRKLFCDIKLNLVKRPPLGGCDIDEGCYFMNKRLWLINPPPFDKITLTDINGNITNLDIKKKGEKFKVKFFETGSYKMKLINGSESEELSINVEKNRLFPVKKIRISN